MMLNTANDAELSSRQKLSRTAQTVNRECGLTAPIGGGSGDLGDW
jgi:hypothetical protein